PGGRPMSAEQRTAASVSGSISPLTEQEQQIHEDYEWALHDPGVRTRHGGQVVAIHRRQVWGAGADHAAALQAGLAVPGCPARQALALVVVPQEGVDGLDETAAGGD